MQTDSGEKDNISSDNQILAVIPDNLAPQGEGEPALNITNQEQLKRFAVVPKGAESTGITFSPDFRHMFTNVQHPGNWPHEALDATIPTPDDGEKRATRSATLVISRYDGKRLAE
ncbi:putative phosphatase [Vibrio ishigakensis]|uniref:Putative phosphatase n=1 Tax=Vibrio ishigakensis TaxID=1481914 RepID=A0A0B8Q721_9VIBR|nr:putative phosphatase [Vibrio ishigakensis]